jgi:hypothetical protein
MTDSTPAEQEDSANPSEAKNFRRDLEDRAKAGDEAVKEVAALKRREVFRDAGINPSDKMAGYFMKGYEGDLSVDAIQAEAAAAGLALGSVSSAEANPFQDQLSAEQRIAQAADDAGPVTPPDLNAQIAACKNEDELRLLLDRNGIMVDAGD